jgi:hypothetical protein
MTTEHDTPDNGTPGITDAQAAALYAFIHNRIAELDEALVRTGDDWIEGKFEAYCEVRDYIAALATPSPADPTTASGKAAVTGARYVVRYMELNSGWSWVVWDTRNPDDAITDLWTYETDAIRDCARRNAQESE